MGRVTERYERIIGFYFLFHAQPFVYKTSYNIGLSLKIINSFASSFKLLKALSSAKFRKPVTGQCGTRTFRAKTIDRKLSENQYACRQKRRLIHILLLLLSCNSSACVVVVRSEWSCERIFYRAFGHMSIFIHTLFCRAAVHFRDEQKTIETQPHVCVRPRWTI